MLRMRKGKYVYAQLKIEGEVLEYYIGKLEDIDMMVDAKKLEEKVNNYMDVRDIHHKFRHHYTLLGKFWSDYLDLKDDGVHKAKMGKIKKDLKQSR